MTTTAPGRVLVTDGEFKHTLGIVRALAARGHEVHLLARSTRAPAVHSRAVRAWHAAPPSTAPEFETALIARAKSLAPASVIAVGSGAVAALDRTRDRMPEGIRFMLPSRDALASANDKARTGELARSLGVRTPRERVVVSFDEARAALAELGAPMVLKSAREEGLKVLRYVTAAPALEEAWRAVSERSSAGVLAQEMIEGPGWGFCALYEDGRLLRKFMHRRIREWPPSGGASSCADSVVEQPELERAGRALLDALHWNGVAMVEFKGEPERGTLSLMEINAKFWGSHDLALAAGVDFPGDMVARLEGRELAPQLPYRSVRMTWPFGGDLWHGLFQPSSLGAVLRDAWSSRVAHTWRSNDAAPTWRELMQWIRSAPGAAREFRETRKNNPGSEHR